MRRAFYIFGGALLLILIYNLFVQIRTMIEIEPAKRAVLAIKADVDVSPIPDDARIPAPAEKPNIIVILADDMGWRDVGYNQSEIRTPVMDELASTGVRLNRFYAQPSCSPTRAALMTGKSPLRLGIVNPLSKLNPTGLPIEEITLADRLKAAGYQTALTGKWHLGPRNLSYHPNARGFDHFYGHLTGGVGYYDKVHGGGYDWQRNGETVRDDGYATHLIANEAVELIKNRDPARPLFLYAAFGAPHLPNEAPESAIQAYSKIGDERRRIHAAMVTELDTAIGSILTALSAEGIEQNTLIWFMSDNGGLYPYNPARHLPKPLFKRAVESRFGLVPSERFADFLLTNLRDGGSDNRPFKGGKQTVSEGGVRVPAFIYMPSEFGAQSYNYMATVQDVMPTLMEIAGAPISSGMDGRSLWSAIKTGTPAPGADYIVQAFQGESSEAIYRYPHKLIQREGATSLYDLEDDPLEQKNIARENPELVGDLAEALAAFPRGPSVAIPLQNVIDDPDYFGGEEDRAPWADQAYAQAPDPSPTPTPITDQ